MAAEQRKTSSLPTHGQLVPFPLSGRTATVRRCATELENKHGEEAVVYWRSACRTLADQLLALGCSDADMRDQVAEFQHEVQAELMRRHWPENSAEANNR